jgi:hypothetical protein
MGGFGVCGLADRSAAIGKIEYFECEDREAHIKRSPWLVGRRWIEGNGGDVLASNLARLMYILYILAVFKHSTRALLDPEYLSSGRSL